MRAIHRTRSGTCEGEDLLEAQPRTAGMRRIAAVGRWTDSRSADLQPLTVSEPDSVNQTIVMCSDTSDEVLTNTFTDENKDSAINSLMSNHGESVALRELCTSGVSPSSLTSSSARRKPMQSAFPLAGLRLRYAERQWCIE